MQVFLTTTIFLSSVITEGSSLICEHCLSINNNSCSGSFDQCPQGVTHCINGLRNKTVGPKVVLTAFKGCLKPAKLATCGKEVVITGAGISLQITRNCCDSDKCNHHEIYVHPVNVTANGYKCPACFTDQSSDGCTPAEDILCVGKEDKCTTFTKSGSKPGKPVKRYSMRGCATTDACDVGLLSMVSSKSHHFDLKCIASNKV
ncbi:phospholipase A2 inhibitor and Ly6/PLAUR domain-containing protein-like [Lissotriton helveticus]